MAVAVTDVEERHRFEATVDGRFAGYAEYIRSHTVVVYPHTEVDSSFE